MQRRDLDVALSTAECPLPVDSPMSRQHRGETTRLIDKLQSELNVVRIKLEPADIHLIMVA
jgi:hypothetical protein